MKTIDILKPVLLLCALVTGNASVRADIAYKLTQVTSVEAGCLYVFEQTVDSKSYVMINEVSSNALKTTNTYSTTGLSGTESYVWTLESKDDGFYMKNVSRSTDQYLNNSSSTNVSFVSKSSKPSVWTFNFQEDKTVLIQKKHDEENERRFLGMNTDHYYKAYAPNYNNNMATYEHDVKVYRLDVPVEIGAAGIATFCSDKALDFTGVNAIAVYKAKVEDGVVKLHQIHKVPANTGVILMNALGRENGAVASVNVPVLTGSADDVSDNELVGVTTRTLVAKTGGAGYNYIMQSDGTNGIVFNMATTDGAYMPAGKAYLSTTVDASASNARLSVVFADEAQGISATLNNKEIMNNVVYDLQGRRVDHPTKGLYILNGKKTVVK